MTLPLILLGAGAVTCVAAGYSLWRRTQRPAETPLPVAVIVGSSLAETLHGPTVTGTCDACGQPLRFAVESLPSVGDVLCPNCGEPVDPDGLELRQADRVAIVPLAEVERPSVGLLYIFAAPAGEDGTPIVKRVVAPPGWRIAIDGGDLYLDGNLVRKSPHDETFPRVLVQEERPAQDERAATSFWSTEILPENRVSHEFRPLTIWARQHRPTPALDSHPSQAMERRRLNAVPDIWVVGESRSEGPADAEFLYRTDAQVYSLRIAIDGKWSLSRDGLNLASDVLLDWSELETFRFGLLDRQIFLVRPDRESIVVPLDDVPFDPSPSPLGIVVPADVSLTVRRVERDVYYLPPAGATEPWIEPQDAVREGWFVLGDYPSYSIDSRQFGRLPPETILGKPLLPPLDEVLRTEQGRPNRSCPDRLISPKLAALRMESPKVGPWGISDGRSSSRCANGSPFPAPSSVR